MPFAKKEDRDAYMRGYMRDYLAEERKKRAFREAEATRKSSWYQRKVAEDPTFAERMRKKRLDAYYAKKKEAR